MKRFIVPMMLVGAVALSTGCPDGTPGKETVRNSWEDMLDELRKMDDESMKKNWKRYYQRAVAELEAKVKDLNEKKIDLLTKKKLAQKDLDELQPKAASAKKLLKGAIAKYKEQKAEGKSTFAIKSDPTQEMSGDEARELIRRWNAEFKRNYSDEKIKVKVDLARKLTESVGKIQIAIDTYKDKISELNDQMLAYEAELELAKVRDSMNALAQTGVELGSHSDIPSLDQLTTLNKSLDKAIARSEVEADLAKEETELKTKFSSLDDEVGSVGADLQVDAELEKEISEIQ